MIPLAIAVVMAAFIVYRVGASLDPRRKQRERTPVERLPSAKRRMRAKLRVLPPRRAMKPPALPRSPELLRPPNAMPPAPPQAPNVEPWSADDWSSILRRPKN